MLVTNTRSSILLATCLLAPVACDDDPDVDDASEDSTGATVDEADPATLADCNEADFEAPFFMGPAFDPTSGVLLEPLPDGHIIATTAGWSKLDQASGELLGEHSNFVIMDIFQHEGLLGATFGLSETCGAARTLSIWRDEAALMGFVTGTVHATAISEAISSTRAWETTHWTDAAAADVPTWDDARARLASVRGD